MRVACSNLTILLNALYERGDEEFAISHPSNQIGELLRVRLGSYDDSTVEFTTSAEEYATARNDVGREYAGQVYQDLPAADEFVKAVLASGVIDLENQDEIETFLDRYGDPDLMAGHPPVFAGFDTNLLPWRVDRLLGLRHPDEGVGYVNGFVLATGVRDELDWDYKCHDVDPFVEAFGDEFEAYWNQPLGSARIGRLGLLGYRTIRDIDQAHEIRSEEGDEAIIAAYDEYDQGHRSDIILFSNDRNFVEWARSHTMLGQRVDFPSELPEEASATWEDIELLVYTLAIVFGVISLPGVTVHGVWKGKDELDWQYERVKLDARSPKIGSRVEGDLTIVESYEELTGC